MKTTHTLVVLFPGSIMSEEDRIEVEDWSIEDALDILPTRAFAFYFTTTFERDPIPDGMGGYFKVEPKVTATSRRYYPDGVLYDLDDVAYMFGRTSTLYMNMKGNGWDYVVKTRAGNFQKMRKNDMILP